MRRPRAIAIAAAIGMAAALPSAPATQAAGPGIGNNITHIANERYPVVPSTSTSHPGQAGTDLELTTLTVGGVERDFAVAGTYRNGLQLLDVTDPTDPVLVQSYDCHIAQGDVQILKRAGRTYAIYTADDISSSTLQTSKCFQDVDFKGGRNKYGSFIIDITNPDVVDDGDPLTTEDGVRAVGFAQWQYGSHNITLHPSGDFLFNSNQDLEPFLVDSEGNPDPRYQIEVFSIAGDDIRAPRKVQDIRLTTGAGPHDITFNADGSRGYVAAVSHTVVLDTTQPAASKVIGVIEDPAISIHHQSDPITVNDPILGERTFLVVSDELAGVIQGSYACPGGALHIYDITGDLERTPVKVGVFEIPQVVPPGQIEHGRCTAHVFKAYPESGLMTIAWYGAGVRVLDISGLAGVSAGVDNGVGSIGAGIKQVGWFYFPGDPGYYAGKGGPVKDHDASQTWSVKAIDFDPVTRAGYLFANDLSRGFDVYRYDGGTDSGKPGVFTSASDYAAKAAASKVGGVGGDPRLQLSCLIVGDERKPTTATVTGTL